MAIIIYNDLIIKKKNNKYKILFDDNSNIISIKNDKISRQIQFKLRIRGFYNFSLENKNYDIEEDTVYFISFILEKNQEININFYNNNLDNEKNIIIEDLSEHKISDNQKIIIDKVYIINLERRPDRKEKILSELLKVGITNYEFINAIDGKNPDVYKMYKKLKYEKKSKIKTAGHLGCLLSHVNALKKAYNDGFKQSLIIEDDIFFKNNNFLDELKNIVMCPWKIIFLGAPIIEKKIFLNKWAYCNKFPGTYGYIIKRELIKKTLSLINKMNNCIDLIFIKSIQKSNYCFILNDFVLTDINDSDTSKKRKIFQKLINNLNRDL